MRDLVPLNYQVSESLHRPCDAVDRHSTRVFSRRVAFAHEGRQLPRIAIVSLYPLLTLAHLGTSRSLTSLNGHLKTKT